MSWSLLKACALGWFNPIMSWSLLKAGALGWFNLIMSWSLLKGWFNPIMSWSKKRFALGWFNLILSWRGGMLWDDWIQVWAQVICYAEERRGWVQIVLYLFNVSWNCMHCWRRNKFSFWVTWKGDGSFRVEWIKFVI